MTSELGSYVQSAVWLAPFRPDSVAGVTTEQRRQDFLHALGSTILGLRVELGPALEIYSQAELAARVGVSPATLLRWENGLGAPDAWEISRLCDIFGIEPAELIRPAPMTAREREVLRRAGRQVRRSIDRDRDPDRGTAGDRGPS